MRLGVADHLGWAVAVTAAADHAVVDRRRIELVEPGVSAAPIHYQRGRLDVAATAALVATAGVGAAGVLGGARRPRRRAARARRLDLAAVLAARLPGRHRDPAPRAVRSQGRRIMYRHLLAELAHARGWEVHCYDAKHVEAHAADLLGERADEVLRGPRAALGPPWTKDHRMALAATVVAGEGQARRRSRDATPHR